MRLDIQNSERKASMFANSKYIDVYFHVLNGFVMELHQPEIESLYNILSENNMCIETEYTLLDRYDKECKLLPSDKTDKYRIQYDEKQTDLLRTVTKSALIEIFILYEMVYCK
jgi:hypothetical protein